MAMKTSCINPPNSVANHADYADQLLVANSQSAIRNLQSAICNHQLRHLIRQVWLQALRCKEVYVVLILMGLYMLGALVLRVVGIETPQAARFVSGLGLQTGALLASLLVIFMGAR